MNSEQWKSDGDCKLCRRKNYCGKTCKAHNLAAKRMLRSLIIETVNEVLENNSQKQMQ